MQMFCIFFVRRLSVAYLSSVSQLSVILVGIRFLSEFGFSSVHRLFVVRLSSVCRLPVPLYLVCVVCFSSVSSLPLVCLSSAICLSDHLTVVCNSSVTCPPLVCLWSVCCLPLVCPVPVCHVSAISRVSVF